MKYVAVLTSVENLGTISDFVVNQLENHFHNWSSKDSGSEYSLQWVKDSLILKTNSSYLLTKWLNIEKQYLNYLLDESQFVIEEVTEPSISNAA